MRPSPILAPVFGFRPARLALLLGLLPALLVALLAGCGKTPGPVRLDFVGAANLTSSDRTVNATDTVAVRVFAETAKDDPHLKHLTITVTAMPRRRPFRYPASLANFRAEDQPAGPTQTLLDLDLTDRPRSEFAFQTTLTARATTGAERWEFTVTDADGNTATRAFRLVVRRPDSAALVQAHTLLARPGRGPQARPFLALDSGQLLPRYAARPAANVIDAQLTETAAGVRLAAFRGRATRLRRTALTEAAFAATATAEAFETAFDAAPPLAGDSAVALAQGTVVAYRTAGTGGNRYGLLQVADLVRTPVTTVRLRVRTAK